MKLRTNHNQPKLCEEVVYRLGDNGPTSNRVIRVDDAAATMPSTSVFPREQRCRDRLQPSPKTVMMKEGDLFRMKKAQWKPQAHS